MENLKKKDKEKTLAIQRAFYKAIFFIAFCRLRELQLDFSQNYFDRDNKPSNPYLLKKKIHIWQNSFSVRLYEFLVLAFKNTRPDFHPREHRFDLDLK